MLVQAESHFVTLRDRSSLHLRRIYKDPAGMPLFCLHGSLESGRAFYSNRGKGLAYVLANAGYDVYVGDLRGRGLSKPSVSRHTMTGQREVILEEIPAFIEEICRIRGRVPMQWLAHSWGGVFLASHYARCEDYRDLVRSMVFFGTKRSIRVVHLKRLLGIELVWKALGRVSESMIGYFPVRMLGLGPENEPRHLRRDISRWIDGPWKDPKDGFDYAEAAKPLDWPPILSMTGCADTYLGHPSDVKDFAAEIGGSFTIVEILGKNIGNLHDYGHVDILTHPDAPRDHFLRVKQWLGNHAPPMWSTPPSHQRSRT